jgi:hypothetical protein
MSKQYQYPSSLKNSMPHPNRVLFEVFAGFFFGKLQLHDSLLIIATWLCFHSATCSIVARFNESSMAELILYITRRTLQVFLKINR